LRTAHSAKRTEGCQQINRLQHIGLSLSVATQQQMESRRKIRVQPLVIAEISQP